jgi:hypothetical protein
LPFEFDDEPQPRPRGQGEGLLRDTQALASAADYAGYLLGVYFKPLPQKCYRTGNIWADLRQVSNKYSRMGNIKLHKPIKFLNHSRTGTLFELGNKAKEFIEECASKSWSLPQGDFLSLAILRYVGRCFVSGKN